MSIYIFTRVKKGGRGGVGEYLGRIISRCIKNNADLFYLHNVAYLQKHSSSLKC